MRFWKSPNTKDVYRLSWVSLVCTVLGAIAGLALFKVNGRYFHHLCWFQPQYRTLTQLIR